MTGSTETLRIATRKSALALWQAEHVRDAICARHPGLDVELVTFSTRGDRILDTPLAKVGGKGLFVKELESAMLAGEADLAVHSMKDVPMELPEGLSLAAICRREDPTDALVSNVHQSLDELPTGAVIGTSSLRRQCQLRALRPDLQIEWLRGNVNSRLARLDEGRFDAIVLATSGLERLGFGDRIRQRLSADLLLPAGGQGALGIELRDGDDRVAALIAHPDDADSSTRVRAERALNRRLQGGCQVPIGCFAQLDGDRLRLRGLVGSLDGTNLLREELTGAADQPEALGEAVAERLLNRGADRILSEVYGDDRLD